jgi:hypothetical protein
MSSQRSLEQHLDRYVNLKSRGRWNIIVRVTLRAAGGPFNGHREVAVQCARVVNLTSWIHKQTFGESGSFFSITLMLADEYGSPFARHGCPALDADNDYETVQAWLSLHESLATQRTYRKEAERLILWAIVEHCRTAPALFARLRLYDGPAREQAHRCNARLHRDR